MGGFWGVFSSDFGVSFQGAPKETQRNAKGKTHMFSYEITVFLYVSCVLRTFICPLLTRFPFQLSQVLLSCEARGGGPGEGTSGIGAGSGRGG